jgi:hypothetical protein
LIFVVNTFARVVVGNLPINSIFTLRRSDQEISYGQQHRTSHDGAAAHWRAKSSWPADEGRDPWAPLRPSSSTDDIPALPRCPHSFCETAARFLHLILSCWCCSGAGHSCSKPRIIDDATGKVSRKGGGVGDPLSGSRPRSHPLILDRSGASVVLKEPEEQTS